MIVELCGLPGAGKSTLLNEFITNNLHLKIWTREEIYDGRKIERTIRYLVAKKLGIGADVKLYRAIKNFSQQYPSCTERYEKRLFGIIVVLKKSSKKLVVLEEGLIQYVSSIAYKEELCENNTFEEIMSIIHMFDEYKVVYCDLDIEECISRVKKRNKKGDRYNLEELVQMKELLEIKRHNIKKVIEKMNISETDILKLNTTEKVEFNIKKLQKFIFNS